MFNFIKKLFIKEKETESSVKTLSQDVLLDIRKELESIAADFEHDAASVKCDYDKLYEERLAIVNKLKFEIDKIINSVFISYETIEANAKNEYLCAKHNAQTAYLHFRNAAKEIDERFCYDCLYHFVKQVAQPLTVKPK
jgi:hypothetical protein